MLSGSLGAYTVALLVLGYVAYMVYEGVRLDIWLYFIKAFSALILVIVYAVSGYVRQMGLPTLELVPYLRLSILLVLFADALFNHHIKPVMELRNGNGFPKISEGSTGAAK